MIQHPYITGSLLAVVVILTFLCAVGLLVMRDPYQRMQFATPVVSIAILLITASIWIEDPHWQARIKSAMIALLLFLMNSILSHATARAIRLRDADHWPLSPEDQIPIVNDKGQPVAQPVNATK
jgi:monovalent cation/proton antiporter MnhG/PhaG subunit